MVFQEDVDEVERDKHGAVIAIRDLENDEILKEGCVCCIQREY